MNHFDNLHPLIKFSIAIPIIILILAVFIQTSRKDRGALANRQNTISTTQNIGENTSSNEPESLMDTFSNSAGKSFDFEKEQQCSFADKSMSVEATIKNRQMAATVTQEKGSTNYLITNDCLYQWENSSTTGMKVCGISQYLSMLEMFSSFLSPGSMLSSLPGLGSALPVPQELIGGFLESCTETSIDDTLFSVPTNISFQEKSIEEFQLSEE